jgi:hypothetical protein
MVQERVAEHALLRTHDAEWGMVAAALSIVAEKEALPVS